MLYYMTMGTDCEDLFMKIVGANFAIVLVEMKVMH